MRADGSIFQCLPGVAAPAVRSEADGVPGRGRAGFFLFLLVNVVLFIRPAELIPGMQGMPIYEVAMVGALIASAGILIEGLSWRALSARPVTLCVLGMFAAIILSHVRHFNLWGARQGATAFYKVLLYFVLLVGLVNSEKRLRFFLLTMVALTSLTAALSLLNHHGVVEIEAFKAVDERLGIDEETGMAEMMPRVQGLGIFGDPNDFALVLVVGMLVALHLIIHDRRLGLRLFLTLPLVISACALALTSSRGGLLALMAGLMVLMIGRWGVRRAIPLAVVAIPLVLLAYAGRQTNINLEEGDTALGRIKLWRDGLVLFHGSPLFGIGRGIMAEENGHVAHNAYVHAFTELGLFGGTIFIGMAFLSFMGVYGLRWREVAGGAAAGLAQWRPCLLSVLTAYATGISFLSRTYALPTYLVFGIATAYYAIGTGAREPRGELPVSARLCARVGLVSAAYLICVELFVRAVL